MYNTIQSVDRTRGELRKARDATRSIDVGDPSRRPVPMATRAAALWLKLVVGTGKNGRLASLAGRWRLQLRAVEYYAVLLNISVAHDCCDHILPVS